jgi:hypothetical protein
MEGFGAEGEEMADKIGSSDRISGEEGEGEEDNGIWRCGR